MHYYYECEEIQIGENLINIEWHICRPDGTVIAEAKGENEANEIVTLMNGG